MEKQLTDKEKTALLMLQEEFNSFDFSPLMRDQVETSWTKFLPAVSIVFDVLLLIIILTR